MISIILFIYIGIKISAPWQYYALIGATCLIKVLAAGCRLGKKAGELSDD